MGLGKLAGHNVLDVIKNLKELRNKALPQNEKGKSSARKIKPEETFVNWEKDKPENIKQKFRAFSGSNMNALKTIFQTKVVFFVDIEAVLQKDEEELLNNYKKTNCGGIFLIKDKRFKKFLYVKCKDGWVKVMKWRFHDQGVKESHVFISQFMNKDKVYEGEDSYSPYSFTSQ